jgi:tellurite resistance protein TehA-like permease
MTSRHSHPVAPPSSPGPLSDRTNPRAARVPMGPPWWGAVMGTGIVSTLTQLHAGTSAVGLGLARFFLICGWAAMVGFSAGFLARIVDSTDAWRTSITGVGSSAWGMVSMGMLAVGSATATVLPTWAPGLAAAAWCADEALWSTGTVIGLLSGFGFVLHLLKHRPAEPRPAWGLAIVPPMVSATAGAPLVARIGEDGLAFALLVFLAACFVCALTLGIVIFTAAYRHHLFVEPIPVAMATSAFIPLGVVGQSTAASQVIAAQGRRFLTPQAAAAAQQIANCYGYVLLAIAIPLLIFAVVVTLRAAANRMPFTPGWWALTFPIGTLSLGALDLDKGSGIHFYAVASTAVWGLLLGTWTLCAVASGRSLRPRPAT